MKSTKRDIQRLNRLSIVFVTRVYCNILEYFVNLTSATTNLRVLALKHVREDLKLFEKLKWNVYYVKKEQSQKFRKLLCFHLEVMNLKNPKCGVYSAMRVARIILIMKPPRKPMSIVKIWRKRWFWWNKGILFCEN